MKFKHQSAQRAFTFVELLVVIIILAVLAAVVIPRFADSGLRSKESALKANLRLYRGAVEMFRNDTGAYPASLADLAATSAPAKGLDSTGGCKGDQRFGLEGTLLAEDRKRPCVRKPVQLCHYCPKRGQDNLLCVRQRDRRHPVFELVAHSTQGTGVGGRRH